MAGDAFRASSAKSPEGARLVAFQIEGATKSDYKEQKINLDDIAIMKHKKYTVVRIGGMLNITVADFSKKWLKAAIIGKRYDSND